MIAFILDSECTNNTTEYEVLIEGLRKVVNMQAKILKVFGDFEIIIKLVYNSIHCVSRHLIHYQRKVWNLINNFDAFKIISIPHSQNSNVDLLANVASRIIPSKNFMTNSSFVELIFRPSVPHSITNWKVFNDYQ